VTKAQQELRRMARARWHYEKPPSVIEWAEKNIYLDGRLTARPGLYATTYTPYVRGVLEALADPGVHTVTLCWGSQTGKTLTLAVWLAYRIANDPAPALLVMPNADLARSYSETRLTPIFEKCKPVRAVFPRDSDDYKNLEMQFLTMTLSLVGSNSPSNLSSRPICCAVLDELDSFAPADDKNASAYSLALERTKSFPQRKHVLTSTPTVATGDIWQNYLAGTQELYHVPCHACGHMQAMEFSQMRWDQDARLPDGKWDLKRVAESARYECEKCQAEWAESHRRKSIEQGRWVASNANAETGRRSMRLPSWYSPTVTFADVCKKFLTEKHYLHGLQGWVNGWASQPWDDQFDDDASVEIPAGAFAKRQEWPMEHLKLAAIDRQIDGYWFAIRAFAKDGTSRLWDEGQARTIEDVAHHLEAHGVRPEHVCMDSGYETQDSYRICARYKWTAIKGEERANYWVETPRGRMKSVHSTPQPTDAGCMLILLSSPGCQDLLAWLRRGQGPLWEIAHDVSPQYREHMNSHKKVHRINRKTGRDLYEWIRIKQRQDHLYDCETYLAGWAVYGKIIAPTGALEANSGQDGTAAEGAPTAPRR
jgi:Phage terminase large subunit (GpA)